MSGTHWRRPVTKTYDYNFKLGEHYYKPQLDYLETRKGRAKTPPTAKTFAERFAEDPIYGRNSGPSYRKSGDNLGDGLGSARFGSLDDLSLGNKGSIFGRGDNLESRFAPSSPRLIVGDRLLDSVGIKESQLSSALNLNSLNSSFSTRAQRQSEDLDQQSLLSRRKQLVSFAQSADADLVSEDPFKTRVSSKMVAARKQADDMMDEMKRDSETSVSRFRARTQARREEQSQRREDQLQSISSSGFGFADDDETAAVRSRVNEIGLRAKARLAQLEETFPEIEIGSSLAARRAAANASSYADDDSSSRQASSRTVKITKRTVKASYE